MSQEVIQLVGTTSNKVDVTNSNLTPPSYTDISKKRKEKRVEKKDI